MNNSVFWDPKSVESQPMFRRKMSPPSSGPWLAYSSTLKMDTCSFDTSVDFQWTTLRYIPEDRILHFLGRPFTKTNTNSVIFYAFNFHKNCIRLGKPRQKT
jgi:hypothetical protein